MGRFGTNNNKLRLSPSSVNTYVYCGLKYKLRYIDKIPSPIEIEHLEKGKKIHEQFEVFYKSLPEDKKITKEVIEEHKKVFDEGIYYKYKEHFDGFIKLNKNILDNLPDDKREEYCKPIAVEKKLYDEGLDIVGVIDAIYSDGVNNIILDFKTGKPHKQLYPNDIFQLTVYKHLWDLFYPDKKITHWAHFYTATPPTESNPLIKKVNLNSMIRMYKKIEDTRASILSGYFPRCKNTWFCGKCEYQGNCYGDINVETV